MILSLNCWIVRSPFNAAIPTQILCAAIPVASAVGLHKYQTPFSEAANEAEKLDWQLFIV
jgi:hypothetical protein